MAMIRPDLARTFSPFASIFFIAGHSTKHSPQLG